MLCAWCVLLVDLKKLKVAAAAVTQVRGTALCHPHAVRKMSTANVLADIQLN